MKPIFIFICLFVAIYNTKAQEFTFQEPDYDLIKKEILDSSSDFYYPRLITRLVSFDTTLNNDEFRYLYYGYIYQKNYEPYWHSKYEDTLLKYYQSEEINAKDYDKIIELTTQSINEFPFDLRQMNFLAYTYHLKGDDVMAKKVSYRFYGTVDAILSTGDGKTCKTGFHVISTSHEYVILNVFQFQLLSQALTGNCDYMQLVKDKRNIDGIYFNIQKLLEKNMEKFKMK